MVDICLYSSCIREETILTSKVLVICKKIVESEIRAVLSRNSALPSLQVRGQPEGLLLPSSGIRHRAVGSTGDKVEAGEEIVVRKEPSKQRRARR